MMEPTGIKSNEVDLTIKQPQAMRFVTLRILMDMYMDMYNQLGR